MKRGIIILMTCLLSVSLQAQKLNVTNAIEAIKDNDIAKAKTLIDQAVKNESTKKSGTAWLVRAFVYQAIGTDEVKGKDGKDVPFVAVINGKARTIDLNKAKSLRPTTDAPLKNSLKSFNRYLVYTKKPDNSLVARAASMILLNGYGQGVESYKAEQYDKAFEKFALVDRIANLKKGKFIPELPAQYNPFKAQIKDVQANILKLKASALYNKGDDDATLPVLLEAMKNPKSATADMYLMVANIYQKKGETAKYESILKEGMSKYPKSKALENEELNYLIRTGKVGAALKKFEDAIAKDPTNAEYHMNAGAMYAKMAKTGDAASKESYFKKSEASYKKAIELDASKPDYQFNLGALYYNQAKEVGDVMNNTADNAKYKVMKKEYDAILAKAVPILEKTKTTLEGKDLTKARNRSTYSSTLGALKDAYLSQNQLEKAKAINTLIKKYK